MIGPGADGPLAGPRVAAAGGFGGATGRLRGGRRGRLREPFWPGRRGRRGRLREPFWPGRRGRRGRLREPVWPGRRGRRGAVAGARLAGATGPTGAAAEGSLAGAGASLAVRRARPPAPRSRAARGQTTQPGPPPRAFGIREYVCDPYIPQGLASTPPASHAPRPGHARPPARTPAASKTAPRQAEPPPAPRPPPPSHAPPAQPRPAPRRPPPKPSERHRADSNRRFAPNGREPHHSATVSAPSSRAHQNQRWCATSLGDLAEPRGGWTCSPTWAKSLVSAPVISRTAILLRSRPRRRPYEAARRPTAGELVTGGTPYSCVLSR